MLGPKPNLLLRFSWSVVSPVVLGVLVIFYFYDWTPIVYNNKEAYPEWADYLGLVLGALSIIQIPIVALLMICRKKVSEDSLSRTAGSPAYRSIL